MRVRVVFDVDVEENLAGMFDPAKLRHTRLAGVSPQPMTYSVEVQTPCAFCGQFTNIELLKGLEGCKCNSTVQELDVWVYEEVGG